MIDPSQIDPHLLPSVALKDRRNLPDESGIYFAITPTEVLYIGQARRLVMRWSGVMHHRYRYLSTIKDVRIAWLAIDNISLLDTVESDCIDYFSPVLNGLRISLKSAPQIKPIKRLASNILVLAAKKAQQEDRRISLRKIAEETGIQRYTIYGFANNTLKEYPDSVLDTLCRYFRCRVGDLLVFGDE